VGFGAGLDGYKKILLQLSFEPRTVWQVCVLTALSWQCVVFCVFI